LRKSLNNINVVQPDLVVICDLEEKLNNDDRYMGIPVLAIEIISKSTRSRDTIKKMELYMLTGVSEYWLINPADRDVIVYFFKDKEIAKSETFKKDETLKSFYFPDLQIKLKDIFGA
jgi:Uma2 family endonuclease